MKRSQLINQRRDEILEELIRSTPARIGVGRVGTRPLTSTLLKLRLDHAAAVDAVYGEVRQELLEEMKLFSTKTMCRDKEMYLKRPDLGRRLNRRARLGLLASRGKASSADRCIGRTKRGSH